MIIQVLQAKRWLRPDVTEKYQELIESMLSYSRTLPAPEDPIKNVPKTPPNDSADYEIAFLGLSQFVPKEEATDENISQIQATYYE